MKIGELIYRESLQENDPEVIGEIVKSSGFFYPDEIAVAVELARENLEKGPESSGYHFILAESEKKVLGYTCFGPIPCTKNSYDLYWIAVHEEYRNLGLGKKLLKESETKIKALGGKKVYIETSSRDLYLSTRQFYLGYGYKIEAVLKEFYDQGDDKLIFVNDLGPVDD